MAGDDVEMKGTDDKDKKVENEEPAAPPPLTPLAELKANIILIERAVSTLEPRFTHRVLRTLTAQRRKVDDKVLRDVIEEVFTKDASVKESLLQWLPNAPPKEDISMDVDATPAAPSKPTPQIEALPETEVYIRLLLIYYNLESPTTRKATFKLVHETIDKIQAWNRRSMDPLAARVWFALGRTYERAGELSDIRPLLLSAQRTASLRHDDECLAVLINLLLRNYLHYNLYVQADKLVSKTNFPTSVGNAQLSRYHYYLGRIKAVQLDYSEAHTNLQQAIRRAPPAKTAPGFYQAVHKFFIVVELLMGDIPERSLFRHPVLENALAGYFQIVKAVRTGSLAQFQSTLSAHRSEFTEDKTYTLILRLRQNVIKTGVRRLSLSYSRISLRDICVKLNLDSEEDAEYIVGKAIRDTVIEGKIVHEKGWLECGGGKSGYGPEVCDVFGKRIKVCHELHNESVKAMRYPLNAHRRELAAAEGAREREKELAKDIQEGDLDEDDLGDGGIF